MGWLIYFGIAFYRPSLVANAMNPSRKSPIKLPQCTTRRDEIVESWPIDRRRVAQDIDWCYRVMIHICV